MSFIPLTQLIPVTPNVAPMNYRLLEGDWPILDTVAPVQSIILDKIKSDANGYSITTHMNFLSLGCFFIDTDLLEPHPTQRPINQAHVTALLEDFEKMGVLRVESPGVVIGLGNGWLDMKNSGPHAYRITTSCDHLNQLSTTQGGPIGQIIRGGHRTAAIKQFSKSLNADQISQNFWYYHVLIPGKSWLNYILNFFTYS